LKSPQRALRDYFGPSTLKGVPSLPILVAEGSVPGATSDLAFFDRRGLEALLPGVILPDHCRRREFITNYLAESDPPCVDLYSASWLPLVRHPFISTLNPLLFGHPSKSEIKSPQLTL
jgi:Predicted ATP-dependent Lon-type protease